MTHGKRMIQVRNGTVYDDQGGAATAEEYIESEQSTFTGLYDADGTPLHRARNPIGYDPHRWATKKQVKLKKRGR